jgi:hypothetical protein
MNIDECSCDGRPSAAACVAIPVPSEGFAVEPPDTPTGCNDADRRR